MQDKNLLCAVSYTPLFLLFTSLKRFYQIGSQFLLNRNWMCIWRVVTMGVFFDSGALLAFSAGIISLHWASIGELLESPYIHITTRRKRKKV